MTIKEQIFFLQEGGWVERFHTRSGIKPDTDAHHSHVVAMLCYMLTAAEISDEITEMPSAHLLMAALTHDLAEQVASDVSSPTKRLLNLGDRLGRVENGVLGVFGFDFKELLTIEEKHILSLADSLAGLLYCAHEAALGNKLIRVPGIKFLRYVSETYLECAPANDLIKRKRVHDVVTAVTEIYKESCREAGPCWDCFEYVYDIKS